MLIPALYGFGVLRGNVAADRLRDRLRREALRREPPRRPRRRGVAVDDRAGAGELRLERRDRLLRRLRLDPVPLQVEPDRRVTVTARGERPGALAREPQVVHVAQAPEGLQ